MQHNSAPNLYGTSTIHALSAQLSFNQFIWKHLRVNGSLSKSFNWGYQGPANRDPFGVNLTVQGNLYKTNVTWSITANDLLDQLADQGRTVSRNEVIDYNNNTRGRYVLASINWRLGKFGGQW